MTRLKKALLVLALLPLGLAIVLIPTAVRRHANETAQLFPQLADVPSVSAASIATPPEWAAAVERARAQVRAAMVEQNLPGTSVAVAAGGTTVWAEGFGYRDVVTRTPVTPETRFNIGTAAKVVMDGWGMKVPGGKDSGLAVHLNNTGLDEAAEWSPEHTGEEEEDPPPFRAIREGIFEPLGLADPPKPLPGERSRFYVPRAKDQDPRAGRRPMRMRDLACCVSGKAFYSTPSDLVRWALATSKEHPAGGSGSFDSPIRPARSGYGARRMAPDMAEVRGMLPRTTLVNVNGELAGGSVMSLVVRNGVVVVVTSNVAHANTAALAEKVAEAFGK